MNIKSIGEKYNDYIAYGIRFFGGLNFILPIWFFFYTQYLGISVSFSTFLVVLSTGVSILFEVPTGTWADKYGRKKVWIWGMILSIVGFLPYLLTKNIPILVVGVILSGIGGAITSGCISSLIYDWYKSNNNESEFKKYSRNASSISFIARAIATVFSGWMFTINPMYPYIAIGICKIIQLLLSFFFNESQINHTIDSRSTLQYIQDGRDNLSSSYSLNTLLIGMLGGYALGSVIWSLYQPFMESNGLTIESIGLFYTGVSFISFIGSRLTKYFYKENGSTKKIGLLYLGSIVIVLVGFLGGGTISMIAGILLMQLAFGAHDPITQNALNHHIDSTHRATANSILSLLDSGGWFIGGSLGGVLLTQFGFNGVWMILLVATLLTITFIALRKKVISN